MCSSDLLCYVQDDLVKLKDIENGLVIFCMATYGEGDPTDNAHELHEWLQNEQDLEGEIGRASCRERV